MNQEGTTIPPPPRENKRNFFGTNFYDVIKYCKHPGKIFKLLVSFSGIILIHIINFPKNLIWMVIKNCEIPQINYFVLSYTIKN